jgi:long-chain acyl-CoA synthetase
MNLVTALLASAEAAPGRPALVGAGEVVSHGELAARARRAAGLLGGRVAAGDRVAIVAGNEPAFVTAYLGALAAGAVVVPLDPSAPAQELARALALVEPAVIVASPEHRDRARRAATRVQSTTPVLALDATVSEHDDAHQPVTRAPDDVAVLLFTAGTAGPPKAAMLTHGSLLANLEQVQGHPGLRVAPDDVALGLLPFFHVFGLNVVLDLALQAGASVALVDHFHPAESLTTITRDGVTVVAAVPAVYAAWAALPDDAVADDAFAKVRLCVSGAAALPPEVASRMRERFGMPVHEGYGLTEASPIVSTSAVAPEPRAGSIGPPLPGVEVRLVDTDGRAALERDPGEIQVRGDNVFAGYWHDDDATARVFTDDGWLRTGDIAVADDEGWLTLVDRAKDVIIVSGFNVYPGEVEDVIADHPSVREVAVVGEAHPRTGETVVAFVVPVEGAQPDPVELLRHAGRRLARYKLPTRVEVVDALPRSFTGKLLRRALVPTDDTTRNLTPEVTRNPT